ncbi:MAG: hypothetical protein AB7S99_16590 [Pseudodonghicola sp.]
MANVKIPLCTNDLRRPVKAATKLKHTHLPKDLKFECYLEINQELQQKIEDDAVLAEKIFKDSSLTYKKLIKALAGLAQDIDDACGKSLKPKGWASKEWKARAPDLFEEAEAEMLTAARKKIVKWQQVRKDRTKYVIKCSAKVVVGSLAVATTTLGTVVAAPAGGVGLIASIYGNIKAVIAMAKLIQRLRRDVNQAEDELRAQLTQLTYNYERMSKGQVAGREIAKAALEQFLSISTASVSNAENALFDYKGKLDKLEIELSKMGIKLNKALTDQAALDKLIETKIEKMLKDANYKSKKLPKLTASSKKLNETVLGVLAGIEKAITRVDDARARYRKTYKPAVVNLKAKKPNWVQYAETSLKLGDLALTAGFTDFQALDGILVLVDSIGVEIDDVMAEQL